MADFDLQIEEQLGDIERLTEILRSHVKLVGTSSDTTNWRSVFKQRTRCLSEQVSFIKSNEKYSSCQEITAAEQVLREITDKLSIAGAPISDDLDRVEPLNQHAERTMIDNLKKDLVEDVDNMAKIYLTTTKEFIQEANLQMDNIDNVLIETDQKVKELKPIGNETVESMKQANENLEEADKNTKKHCNIL